MGIFTMIGNGIETGTATYVTQTSVALSSALVPVVATALTVWVMAYGFAVMRGEAQESAPAFSWRAAKIAVILAFALGSGIYQSTVLRDVEDGTAFLARTIAEAGGGSCAGTAHSVTGASAQSIYTALDCYDAQMGAVMTADITHAVASGKDFDFGAALAYLFSALVVAIGGSIFLLIACFETILARVFLDLVLGLGPLFIACGAFEPARRFFDAWVGKVVSYSLLQVLIAAFLGVALSVFSSELASLTNLSAVTSGPNAGNLYASVVQQMNSAGTPTTDDQYFVSAFGMLVTGIFLAMLCWQLPSIASALGGGSAVTGVGAFAAGMASRVVPGLVGKALSHTFKGGGGAGGSISRSRVGGLGGSAKPAFQRAVLDRLNLARADR